RARSKSTISKCSDDVRGALVGALKSNVERRAPRLVAVRCRVQHFGATRGEFEYLGRVVAVIVRKPNVYAVDAAVACRGDAGALHGVPNDHALDRQRLQDRRKLLTRGAGRVWFAVDAGPNRRVVA